MVSKFFFVVVVVVVVVFIAYLCVCVCVTGVSEMFVNQREINFQITKLSGQAVILSKNAKKWVGICEELNQSLNEIGDIDNWAKVMDRDVFVIARAVELVKSK